MLMTAPHVGLSGSFSESLRTEDVRFSPSGRLLAVAATSGRIFLFAVDTSSRPVRVKPHVELNSSSLASPHGIDFLSEDVIVVANRRAWVTFYRIPGMEAWQDRMAVEPIHEMESVWFGPKRATRNMGDRKLSCGPGSVRVQGGQLFVCCNNRSTVTAHPYRLQQGRVETGEGAIVAEEGLDIPDGVALSRDGQWMAVSDHNHHRVMIYRRADNRAACELRDVQLRYPHGLCFDRTGRSLYVADAGERQVHVFLSTTDWDRSLDSSAFKLPAVDADAFHRTKEAAGAHGALEGGVKGIDLDPAGRILATTCNHQTLRFFEPESVAVEQPLVAQRA